VKTINSIPERFLIVDPDVDAIYRLTNNTPVYFDKRDKIVLEERTLCPFNSQNTFFRKETFPLLFLPAFVNFRFTDILRGLVAQPLLWSMGFKLGFGQATVIQKRNPHDYLKDFDSEIPCYLHTELITEIASKAISGGNSLSENILNDSFVVSDSKYYYQVSEGNSKIYRYNMDGTGKTLIHSDTNIFCVNLVGEWIYYTRTNPHNDYTYGIYKVKADGTGGLTQLSTDPTEFMVVVGQWVYYVPYYRYSGAITGPDAIKKVNVDGTGSTLIEKQYADKAYYLMTQGDYIYYINKSRMIIFYIIIYIYISSNFLLQLSIAVTKAFLADPK